MKVAFISLAVLAVLAIAGCGGLQERGDRVARELPAAFPDEIVAVSFENAPQVATPTIFIEMSPAMSAEVVRLFLCAQIKPRIDGASGGMDAVTTYGWSMHKECPSG